MLWFLIKLKLLKHGYVLHTKIFKSNVAFWLASSQTKQINQKCS